MDKKRRNFVRLAEKRVNRAIKDLRLVGNLSNRSAYEYSERDVKQILQTLQRELETVRSRFDRAGNSADTEFRLDG